jgi:hypothetical protein
MSAVDMFALGGKVVVVNDHPATREEMTAVEFRAWPEDEISRSMNALSDEAMVAMGAELRLVVRTMSCTKRQLSEEFANFDADDVELLLDQCRDTADCLRALADVVDEAVARWLICACAASS